MSKAGKVKEKDTKIMTRFLLGGDPDLEFKRPTENTIKVGQVKSRDVGFFSNKRNSLPDQVDEENEDQQIDDLKNHLRKEGTIDVSKFRSEQKSKLIKELLKQDPNRTINHQNYSEEFHYNLQKYLNSSTDDKLRRKRNRKQDVILNGIPRQQREQVLSGEKYNYIPPIGAYSPKFEFILKKNYQDIKFIKDSIPKKEQSLERDSSNVSLTKYASGDLPSIIKTLEVPQYPQKPRAHIPNVYISKFSNRKNEALKVNIADDSNIEYKNIFPEILARNKKQAINISLDKQTDRSKIYKDLANAPQYTISYNLTEKKSQAPLIIALHARDLALNDTFDQIQLKKSQFQNYQSARTSLDNSDLYRDLKQSSSRHKLHELNVKAVNLVDQGKQFIKKAQKEQIDPEKEFILKRLNKNDLVQ
ncbi:UNKNOWN [Stylonychia lemnae]|uniref:Uncharacterized protein n=1 Tax=Stylonychia lemnae TaxID=5949 RepID=A0A078A4G5_STYLE|nr:UNKNOWN [Stylonychia lemnae]|eukprot:CDW77148.1 UNKNOWN [Stylonychia lemnae]